MLVVYVCCVYTELKINEGKKKQKIKRVQLILMNIKEKLQII